MITPPLFLGSKFKVLSLVGLSGSGIIGSFSAIHKSADRASETIDPAKAAIRQGLGYMFLGTSSLGSQTDEWLSWLAAKRFIALALIRKNVHNIGSGQKSMVDQGQDWVRTARDAVKDYFDTWLSILPYLFYFWNRKRQTFFGSGLDDIEVKNEAITKILEGNSDAAELLKNLLDDDDVKKGISELGKLFAEFSSSFNNLTGDNKTKAETARDSAFSAFGQTLSESIQAMVSSESTNLTSSLSKIAKAPEEVEKKFQEQGLGSDENAKQAQEATKKLMNWLVESWILPMLTESCSEGEDCASVDVVDEDEEED